MFDQFSNASKNQLIHAKRIKPTRQNMEVENGAKNGPSRSEPVIILTDGFERI